ncbi:MAG TPA: rod shape-determining protein MreD [Alphaproteobacteria bacterium]
MKPTLWQRLDTWARRLLPAGLCLAFVLLSVVPVPVPGYAAVVPMLVLAAVFFWAVHHPRLLPPAVVFAVGLVLDILSGAPMGQGAVVLLAAYGVAASQRRFFHEKSFAQVWAGFVIVALLASILAWALALVAGGPLLPPRAAVFQYLLTVAVYPLVTWVLHGVQRLVPAEA